MAILDHSKPLPITAFGTFRERHDRLARRFAQYLTGQPIRDDVDWPVVWHRAPDGSRRPRFVWVRHEHRLELPRWDYTPAVEQIA